MERVETEHHCGVIIENARTPGSKIGVESSIIGKEVALLLLRQQRGKWRELCEMTRERVKQADVVAIMEQEQEALAGEG